MASECGFTGIFHQLQYRHIGVAISPYWRCNIAILALQYRHIGVAFAKAVRTPFFGGYFRLSEKNLKKNA